MNARDQCVQDVIQEAVETASRPVISAPGGTLGVTVAALAAVDDLPDTRLVTPESELSRVSWGAETELQHMTDRGPLSVRSGPTESLAVVGARDATVIVRCGQGVDGVSAVPSDTLRETFAELWDAAGAAEIDAGGAVDAVRDVAGSDGVDDLRRVTVAAARHPSPKRIAPVVFAAAADAPRLSELNAAVSDRLGVCNETVRQRVRRLDEQGLLMTHPDTSADNSGRPPSIVRRDVDLPLTRRQRKVLLS